MAFRFNNPLRQAANQVASFNRGLGQFGEVSQGLQDFNEVKRSVGRISSSIGTIGANAGGLTDTITNISSAGDLVNTLTSGNNLQTTIRSVSALTRDVSTLIPGGSRIGSQAATLSRKAEDLFANAQRNAQGIKGITGGITDVLNGTLDFGQSNGPLGLGNITGSLGLGDLSSTIRGITGQPVIRSISSSTGAAISNILGSSPSLENIITQTVKVVPRSIAELATPIGERYNGLREVYETQLRETSFDDYVMNTFDPIQQSPLGQFSDLPAFAFGGTKTNAGESYSKIPNPLRNHDSFNYIITLGILSAQEYNNPEIYRSRGGFENYVIRSGGGNYSKRYKVFDEGNENAEYFIDDLEMDAVIAPNPNTNVALGTSLTFRVLEPYSMGNFIEAIIGAAAAAGFANYLDAPYCLRIDFVGWDEFGNQNQSYITNPIFIPIKISKVDMNVDGKGSVYEVKAVPMSETGLGDEVNEIKTPINANGDFVHKVLETGARSVTQVLNDRVAKLEETGVIAPYDRYVIIFPKSREALNEYLRQDLIDPEALKIDVEERIEDAIGGEVTRENATEASALRRQLEERNSQIVQATISSVGRMYAKLKTFAEDEGAMNEIGLATIVENIGEGGNQAHTSQAGSVDANGEPRGHPQRNTTDAAPAERSRDYQFQQGMTITEVIERMCVASGFAADAATAPAQNGIRKWFKIDTTTFIEESPETEAQIGRPPKVYVYSVIPYEADEAKFNAPNERPANTEGLKAAAAKEYNYIYTGKNEDILEFDLTFNNAFVQTAFANFGQNSGSVASGTGSSSVAIDRPTGTSTSQGTGAGTNSATGQVAEATNIDGGGYGDPNSSGDVKRRIAEMFHDRIINQTVDMVTAEMTIFGDPFFIPQEMGNFAARQGDRPNTTEEGTMAYQRSEVFLVVNFKTPFDYQIEGATMEFPKVVPQFSGLFSCWAVTNTFAGGQFKQLLKLIRRRGQDDPPTDNNRGAVQENPETDITGNENGQGETETGNTNPNVNAPTSGTTSTTGVPITAADQEAAAAGGNNLSGAVSPIGRRFGNMDQAISAARAYQANNPGFLYAIRPTENNGFTIAQRQEGDITYSDYSSRVAAAAGTRSTQPTSPAC